jgi:putative membrane protein
VAGLALVLAGFIATGLATGIVRTVLRDYGFRLERTARGFRRRRGLLTRTDVVMPVHRVQAVRVTTGIVRRLWGWHGLSFISLAQDAGSPNHDVAPFARMSEIAPIVRAAGFALPAQATDWHRPAARYHADRAVLITLLAGIAAVVAILLDQVPAGLLLGLLGVVLVIRQYWLWQHDRHALDSRQVLSRRGWLAPQLLIASRVKLHSVEIVQGPLGRWRGYASLRFGLAGGALALPGLPLAEARRTRAAVLESIAAVDFAQLPR